MPEPRKVAWGYVRRDVGNIRYLLVADRFKSDDPQRAGQIVIPGGGLKDREDYLTAARREVHEETGIHAYWGTANCTHFCGRIQTLSRTWELPNIRGRLERGVFHLDYLDSGKLYVGELIRLEPEDTKQEPDPRHVSGDTRNPRYVSRGAVLEMKSLFTPACQIILDTIGEVEGW